MSAAENEAIMPASDTQIEPRAAVQVVIGQRGAAPTNLDELARFASMIAKSGFAPRDLQHPAQIAAVIQTAMELGVPPMTGLRSITMIQGRPMIWGDLPLALARRSGFFDEAAFSETTTGEGETLSCSCTVRRLPNGQLVTRVWDVKRAKTAGLWGKRGPWQEYPERMLQLRARAVALRDTFSDALMGISVREEFEGVDTWQVNQPAPPQQAGEPDASRRDLPPRQNPRPKSTLLAWVKDKKGPYQDFESAMRAVLELGSAAKLPKIMDINDDQARAVLALCERGAPSDTGDLVADLFEWAARDLGFSEAAVRGAFKTPPERWTPGQFGQSRERLEKLAAQMDSDQRALSSSAGGPGDTRGT